MVVWGGDPARIKHLGTGDDPDLAYEPFVQTVLSGIAAATGVSYRQLIGGHGRDFSALDRLAMLSIEAHLPWDRPETTRPGRRHA